MQKKNIKSSSTHPSIPKTMIKQIFSIELLALLLCALFLGIHTFVLTKVNIAHSLYPTTTMILLGIAQFLSAFLLLKRYRSNGFVLGVGSGLVMFLILLLVNSVMMNGPLSISALSKLLVVICSGGLGGILGVNAAEKTKRKKRMS